MTDEHVPDRGPSRETIESVFYLYDIQRDGDRIKYIGLPLVDPESAIRRVWPAFREAGFDARLTLENGQYVIVAEPMRLGTSGVPWTNVILFVATVFSTLIAGSFWYHIDLVNNPAAILQAWPFSAAILIVLGVHELGHYFMSRIHRVQASLPYFIPVPTIIGTMGAVIKMKGRMPDRKALFDIGVAGPLAGLAATIVITIIGLHLEPIHTPQEVIEGRDTLEFYLGYPLLLEWLATAFDQPLYRGDPTTSVNPVVIAGWVGMFVTFLNLIPVGQLDGGHILRAMLGESQQVIGALVPAGLFALAAYLHYVTGYTIEAVFIWIFWGFFAVLIAAIGPAHPVVDESLDRKRTILGIVTFGLGLLCFMPVPFAVVG